MPETKSLRDRVRDLRVGVGLTQQEVGDRGGFPRERVVMVEIGRNQLGGFDGRAKLAKGLGVTLDELTALIDGTTTDEALVAVVLAREPALAERVRERAAKEGGAT